MRTAAIILFAVIVALGAALPACRPVSSLDTIYRDAGTDPDPAYRNPYLGVDGPARADSPIQTPPPVSPHLARPATQPTFQTADVPAGHLPLLAWIDDQPVMQMVGRTTARVAQPVGQRPIVQFKLPDALGEFRGSAIQVYRVIAGQPEIASGLRWQEDGTPRWLLPGRAIDLSSAVALARQTTTGRPIARFELAEASEYEIQFLVSGSRRTVVLAVRVRTAIPPTSQPDAPAATQPADPDAVDPTRLPPGVIVPK